MRAQARALRASTSTAVRRLVPRASLGVSLPPFPAPTHKPANRGLFIWSAALFILAGLCVLGALTLYQTAPRSVSVTAGSVRGVMPLADPPAARPNGAVMPLPIAPAARSNDESNAIDIGRPATDVPASSILPGSLARCEFAMLRECLIKIGARVIEHIARIRVQLPTNCPEGALFRAVALGLMPSGLLVRVLKAYRIRKVVGDRYAASWSSTAFERHGIRYEHSPMNRSELYLETLPALNAKRVRLLDNARLIGQLANLERRTTIESLGPAYYVCSVTYR
jgi:hypothetical protein